MYGFCAGASRVARRRRRSTASSTRAPSSRARGITYPPSCGSAQEDSARRTPSQGGRPNYCRWRCGCCGGGACGRWLWHWRCSASRRQRRGAGRGGAPRGGRGGGPRGGCWTRRRFQRRARHTLWSRDQVHHETGDRREVADLYGLSEAVARGVLAASHGGLVEKQCCASVCRLPGARNGIKQTQKYVALAITPCSARAPDTLPHHGE